jgi:hypothetical protein
MGSRDGSEWEMVFRRRPSMGSSDKGLRVIGVFIVKNQFLVPTITKTIRALPSDDPSFFAFILRTKGTESLQEIRETLNGRMRAYSFAMRS